MKTSHLTPTQQLRKKDVFRLRANELKEAGHFVEEVIEENASTMHLT